MNILMLDMSNISIINAFSVIRDHPEDNYSFSLWRTKTLNSIFWYVNKFKPDRLIVAVDDKNHGYWRKDIYSQYKAHRAAFKADSVVDFEKYYIAYNRLISELAETFSNIYFLSVDKCEADDVIAIISKKSKTDKIIIISGDSDYKQLLTEKNILLYNPLKNMVVECLNPKRTLELKVLVGDKSDNVPPIKRGVGPKKAESLLNENVDLNSCSDQELRDGYKRNLQLIDFNFIPKEIGDKIIDAYNTYDIQPIGRISGWLMANDLIERWQVSKMNFERMK
jgi:5'-3' exonuclease